MIKLDLETTIPEITFKPDLKKFRGEATKATVQAIVDGILSGEDVDGGAFPALSPYTIARKGHDQPLVDTGLLSDPDTYDAGDDGHIYIKPVTSTRVRSSLFSRTASSGGSDTPRDQVAAALEDENFLFFGISKKAEDMIMDILDGIVDDALE